MSLEPECLCGHREDRHVRRRNNGSRACWITHCGCLAYTPSERSTVTATLDTELWVVKDGDGYRLIRPLLINRNTGEGAPGLVTNILRVLRPGDTVEVRE